MTAAEYLTARGWYEREDGFGAMEWLDPADAGNNCDLETALVVQRARDAAEERKCVAEAIANAASRYAKHDNDTALPNVMQAAEMARTVWRRLFGVEVDS